MVHKLVFGASAALAVLALFAGPAQADPKWHSSSSPEACERDRLDTQALGLQVSPQCEFRAKFGIDGNDAWLFWVY